MVGIKQVCVSKKFDLPLFFTGRCQQIASTAVWFYLPCKIYTAKLLCLIIDFYLIKSVFSQHHFTEKTSPLLNSINQFVADRTSAAAWLGRRQVKPVAPPHVGQ